MTTFRTEAERLLRRYMVEVVERFGLCPWARSARENGEIAVEVNEDPADALAAADRVIATPRMTVGMVVLARAPLDTRALRRLRDQVIAARAGRDPAIGVADFHPDAAPDFSDNARAIP